MKFYNILYTFPTLVLTVIVSWYKVHVIRIILNIHVNTFCPNTLVNSEHDTYLNQENVIETICTTFKYLLQC